METKTKKTQTKIRSAAGKKMLKKEKVASGQKSVKKITKTKLSARAGKSKEKAEEGKFFILKRTAKIMGYAFAAVFLVVVLFFSYINMPVRASESDVKVGVTFSYIYAEQIGLDWRKAYLAMLDELNIKDVRLPVYWDRVETAPGEYDFSTVDWQLEQARARGVRVIVAIGKKVPRWPECYIPKWVGSDDATLNEKLLAFEAVTINRYKENHPEIINWQVENEPFLNFGICGKVSPELLDSEIAQTKKIDPKRPVIVTDSGELSLWIQAAKRADIFGTTMYREVYSAKMGHWRYPIGPNFFKAKQLIIKLFAHQDNAIVIELQGEPWVAGWTTDAPVETQLASMNAGILKDNVEFAKKTGMKEIYVWGVEWWYYMKMTQSNSTLWETAKTFNQN